MDRYEVTVAEFTRFLSLGGNDRFYADKMMVPDLCGIVRDVPGKYHVIQGRENFPVVFVDHDAAMAYAQSLGETLPTEAMFERAARGLEGRRYPWGNEPLDPSRANYDFHYGGALPVGCLPKGATPEGIYDLLGNVKEWTDSKLTPYPGGAKFEHWFNFPFFAPPFGEVPANWVNRGGGWTKQEKCMEIGYRDAEAAHNCGFRCVRVGKEK
jgi:formylglycine-generating enzyme required for sulfatase activity